MAQAGRTLKRILILLTLAIVCIAGFLFSLKLGSLDLTSGQIFKAIFCASDGPHYQIIYNIRLPRTLVAACVGICLSLSGCLLQGIMRNPLAAPHIIGVSSGAGLAGVIILILYPGIYYLLPPVAFAGALITTIMVYLIAWRQGIRPSRLILAGVAVSSFLGAMITGLMIFFPDRVHSVLGFMVGGLSARTWKHLHIILPYTILGLLLVNISSRKLNILMLGDETAASLGLNVERTRLFFIALAALLAGSAVSVVGLLGFVGLIVPHITRLIIGSDYRVLLPAAALLGAALVMVCDTVSRVILDPVEVPVGIIMALLGAPFFLYLLRKKM
ncbi:MAG: iron ABC transporter permease [Desulfobacteraceae bacterium]|jgi:iron complex transport system permease protein